MKRRSKHSTRPYQLSTKRELVKMVTGIIKEMKEEKSNTKMIQLAKQGAYYINHPMGSPTKGT